MKEPVFTGVCTAIITPFDQDGAVDYNAFDALIEAQISAGVDALCVCGTTGEKSTLSTQEHVEVMEYFIKKVDHRVKVIAGTGGNDTAASVYLTQKAQDFGADAALMVTPYYNKTTQAGLIKHYTYITDRTDIPLVLYNVPSRTGMGFTAQTYQALAQNPKINGVKEASGNFSLIAQTRQLCGDGLNIWSGNDDQVVPIMALGGKGVVSVASHVIPEVMVEMSHLCLKNDFEAASRLQIEYFDLLNALFVEVNPIPVKAAMHLLGKCSGTLRLPLCDISEGGMKVLKEAMERHGLLK